MPLQTFEDLDVWKRACRLGVDVAVVFDGFKPWTYQDQITRSSLSIPSNIAEGSERDSEGDYVRFLNIAKGSCGELRTQLLMAKALQAEKQKPPIENVDHFIKETRDISSMLYGLIKSVKARSAI